jgi:hypothetical protein
LRPTASPGEIGGHAIANAGNEAREATAQFWIGRLGRAALLSARAPQWRAVRACVHAAVRACRFMEGISQVQLTDSAECTLRKDLLISNLRSSSVMPRIASSIFTPRRCNSRSSWSVFDFLVSCS